MCGRFTITVTIEELVMIYMASYNSSHHFNLPRYNVAPMQDVLAVIHDGKENRIGNLRWGLIPSWTNDPKIGSKMINARAETLLEKASFKNLVRNRRCIIPADSFYE